MHLLLEFMAWARTVYLVEKYYILPVGKIPCPTMWQNTTSYLRGKMPYLPGGKIPHLFLGGKMLYIPGGEIPHLTWVAK
jgi:hypothetical protein